MDIDSPLLDMKYLKYNRAILLNCFIRMFENMNLIETFGIDQIKLVNFLS